MAPRLFADEPNGIARLIRHCGFVQDEPVLTINPRFDALEDILERTIKTIRGQSNEAVEFKVDRENSPWSVSFVPEGVRAIGSGASSAARGGIWHITDPQLLLSGWGYLRHAELDGFLSGECRILTPSYHPDGDVPDAFCYEGQLQPADVDSTSELAELYAAMPGR